MKESFGSGQDTIVEIRCDSCTHVGPAAEVRPGPDGVTLVCENCGHENVLAVDRAGEDGSTARDEEGGEGGQAADSPSFGDRAQVRQWLREDALEALIPEVGPGPRCRKCARLLDQNRDHCARCGLSREEAGRYAPGEAPWERPPEGKEAEHEQARLLWEAFEDDPNPDNLDKFVDFAREHQLLDGAIRRLRFHLADHPDDEAALERLRGLAESLQSKLIVAQAKARADADDYQREVSRFKQRLIVATLVFWGFVFLLFAALFWESCSSGVPDL